MGPYRSHVTPNALDVWSGADFSAPAAPEPDRDAAPDSMVVTVSDGTRIHYLDWPGPLPALVVLHGISQTAWSWAPVARRLTGQARVLAVDLRGHGHSDASRAGYDLESLAFDVLTVMAATGSGEEVGGPAAVVAGHGFGAMVAATAALVQPASVAGLALIDGGWEETAEATRLSPTEFIASIAEPPEVLASMETFLVDRRDFDPATWDLDQERAARAQVEQKHAGHVALVSRPAALRGVVDAMYAYQPADVLPEVRCPLLVMVAESGAADDELVRERRLALDDVLRVRQEVGAGPARIARLVGVGHNLMRYRPDTVTAELLALRALTQAGDQSQR
jgi:pimeloyl-ACP methyl ester carboxylesterase